MIRLLILGTFLCCSLVVFSQARTTVEQKIREVKEVNAKGLIVAFYHSDSLNKKYLFLIEQDSILRREQRKFETDSQHKQQEIEEKYKALEIDQRAMILSAAEMQKKQMQLEYAVQKFQEFQQTEGKRLQNKSLEMQELLQKKVSTYAESFCKLHGLDVLLMQAPGGQFTYLQPALDVTPHFIDFVNTEEAKNKK